MLTIKDVKKRMNICREKVSDRAKGTIRRGFLLSAEGRERKKTLEIKMTMPLSQVGRRVSLTSQCKAAVAERNQNKVTQGLMDSSTLHGLFLHHHQLEPLLAPID